MKNKKLIAVLIGLFLLVVADLTYSAIGEKKTGRKGEDQKVQVGVLQFVSHESLDEIYKGIKAGLRESGYKEGDNLTINFMNAQADQNQVQKMSQKLVTDSNDVLIGIATPAAQGLANASKDRPVIMGAVTDPVGANLVKDLKHPGGNVTGVSDVNPVADSLDLIKAITPEVKTVGIIYASSEDNSLSQVETFTAAAEKAGYQVEAYPVPSTNEIANTVDVMLPKVDAVWTPVDNTIASAFPTLISAANEAKKPVYTSVEAMVEQGGLASVSLSQYDLGVATGKMAADILKGAKPADTPVRIFDQGTVVINQKAVKELGLTLPKEVLDKADKLID